MPSPACAKHADYILLRPDVNSYKSQPPVTAFFVLTRHLGTLAEHARSQRLSVFTAPRGVCPFNSGSVLKLSPFNSVLSALHFPSFFFNDTATNEIDTLSLDDALFFFLKEHAPDHNPPIPLPCRLLL